MKIFIIDFSPRPELEALCRAAGHTVQTERHDGARAYRDTKTFMPDVIVVNYADKPSHGRLTAQKIRQRKATAPIPIWFVDGTGADNAKIQPWGRALPRAELETLIRKTTP